MLNSEEIIRQLSTLSTEVKYLKERDKQLNGTIHTVDKKVDGIKNWIIALFGGIVTSIIITWVK